MKKIFLMMLMLTAFILSGCDTQAAGTRKVDGDLTTPLKISMLNIDHGDAILIQTKDQTILFDSANSSHHDLLVKELEKLSVTKIDKLILTHPHVDHIGGASMLIKPTDRQLKKYPYLEKISVAKVYDNAVFFTNGAYKNYMKAVEATGITRQSLKVGDTLDFGDDVEFKVLWPTEDYVAEKNRRQEAKLDNENAEDDDTKNDREYKMNNSSLVGRLTYKDFSMMFTGDCEKESEAKIVLSNDEKDLKCNILKAGHHGSKNSSSVKFIRAVNPEYILISAGNKEENNNAKGTPHLKLMERYLEQGIDEKKIFCTRWNGTIIVTTDGKTFSVNPEVNVDWVENWIAKKKQTGAI